MILRLILYRALIDGHLQNWENSDLVDMVILTGAGQKAFCAGGDVASLALQNLSGLSGQKQSTQFFAAEYKLNHLIATYEKPIIAILDGITMGGGAGLSCHGPFRVATENTIFAMPETSIGFFPDVGGSFFLSRLSGGIGAYLALTSNRLVGTEVYHEGIATHYIHSSKVADLLATLKTSRPKFTRDMSYQERLTAVDAILTKFSRNPTHQELVHLNGEIRVAIDKIFRVPTTVVEILNRLTTMKEDRSTYSSAKVAEWAQMTYKALMERSPLSMEISLQLLQTGRQWSIKNTFKQEYVVAANFMQHPDFANGVKAKLIDKPPTKPVWAPSRQGTLLEKDLKTFFETPPWISPLTLFDEDSKVDFTEYPHAWTAKQTLRRESHL